ncbi:MAG: HNH endonuclease [Actinobacteria bacterium]|nr:HNH endonuclease [Actinomycetota bacterium]
MLEIRSLVGGGRESHEQLGRRRRTLNKSFVIEQQSKQGEIGHRLMGMKEIAKSNVPALNEKTRALVLQPKRCAQCGRTPLEDGVKLQVDHIVPQEWGGTDDLENLQPLCEECNRGKKNLYSSYDQYADKIRLAINEEEAHKRIGELLKAFNGEWVPSEILGVVASVKQYQEDWQKRTRELRELDWIIDTKKERGGRVVSFYRATHWEAWPPGPVAKEIRRREREKKARKQQES